MICFVTYGVTIHKFANPSCINTAAKSAVFVGSQAVSNLSIATTSHSCFASENFLWVANSIV